MVGTPGALTPGTCGLVGITYWSLLQPARS
jgi:hypothetical protein